MTKTLKNILVYLTEKTDWEYITIKEKNEIKEILNQVNYNACSLEDYKIRNTISAILGL